MSQPSYEQLVEALVLAGEREKVKDAVIVRLEARIDALERRLDADSGSSSRPPSSDNPYRKGAVKGSTRGRSGRKPGKQEGAGGVALRLAEVPDKTVVCRPGACGCGRDLTGVTGSVQRRQVVDLPPVPGPVVTEYQVVSVRCPGCRSRSVGRAPAGVTGRVQYGPGVHAVAAELTCAHYLPVGRAAQLMKSLAGLEVSVGFMAGVRGKAARLLEDRFVPHVKALIAAQEVVHVDETPVRAQGSLSYLHLATTGVATVLHSGDRSAATIDAGGVLPGYSGTIVRDGYAGYQHLADAVHAWCGAHLLRDLAAVHKADPTTQIWARAMADTLIDALKVTNQARRAGAQEVDDTQRTRIRQLYNGAVSHGLTTNTGRTDYAATEGLRLVRRFRDHQDMILRFVSDLAVPFTNNAAERDIRPAKIQQRTSGGAWRTLTGLADFAVVRSYLATIAKHGLASIDALTMLFTSGPYLPQAAE